MMLDAMLEYGDRSRVFRDKLKRLLGESGLSGGLFGSEVPPIEQIAADALGVKLRKGAQFGGPMPRIEDLLKGADTSKIRLSVQATEDNRKLSIRIA